MSKVTATYPDLLRGFAETKYKHEIALINYKERFGNVEIANEPNRLRQIAMEKAKLDIEVYLVNMLELAETIKSIEEHKGVFQMNLPELNKLIKSIQ